MDILDSHDRGVVLPEYNNAESFFNDLFEEMIEYFDQNISNIFKKKKDADIAYALLEIMKRRKTIENFNKKALYLYIREMTGVNTNNITKVVNILKSHYKKLFTEYYENGTALNNNNKFF